MRAKLAAAAAVVLAGGGTATGLLLTAGSPATLYVSPGGTDTAACTASAPCATVNHAIAAAQPGDTVQLEPGSYGQLNITREQGADQPPVTVTGDPALAAQQACVETEATFTSPAPACAHGSVLISGLTVCGHGLRIANLDTAGLSTSFYVGAGSCPDANHVTGNHDIALVNDHFTYQSTLRCHDCSLVGSRVGPNEQICAAAHNGQDGDNLHIWPDAGATPWTVPYNVTLDHDLIYDAREQGAAHGCGWQAHADLVQTLGYRNLTVTSTVFLGCVDSAWQDGLINGTTVGGADIHGNFFLCTGQNGGGGTTQFGNADPGGPCAGPFTIDHNTWISGSSPGLYCTNTAGNAWTSNYLLEALSQPQTCGSGAWTGNVFAPAGVTCGQTATRCAPVFASSVAGSVSAGGWDANPASTDSCLGDAGARIDLAAPPPAPTTTEAPPATTAPPPTTTETATTTPAPTPTITLASPDAVSVTDAGVTGSKLLAALAAHGGRITLTSNGKPIAVVSTP